MKIVHIAYSSDGITSNFAGVRGRFMYNLAREQAQNGYDVTVVAPKWNFILGCKKPYCFERIFSCKSPPEKNNGNPSHL